MSYAEAVPELSVAWRADEAPDPRIVVLNEELADELGLDADWLRSADGIAWLTGKTDDPTFAQAYAGHQFGHYVPRLGDGRAILLAERIDSAGRRRDLHLKGAGRTPFARGADGKAVIGPMLREYIVGESLHALGVPTTRALAVLTTGERVWREDGIWPGAILCRVAASHLRVGTFQYVAAQDAAASADASVLQRLADYAIARHYPDCEAAANPYLELYRQVVTAQASLLADWMSVGFVHGVMNTDNMTISGESIDFGPCAFLDAYVPDAVFSSIDRRGRYAYENQPAIAQWNLARFAETLLPLAADDPTEAAEALTEVFKEFAPRYQSAVFERYAAKLGLPRPDEALTTDLLHLLAYDEIDFTGFFRALAAGEAVELFDDRAAIEAWLQRREALLPDDQSALPAAMNRRNPLYIPRNHVVEDVLARASALDLAPLHRLLDALRKPWDARPGLADLAEPAPPGRPAHVTYCGT